MLQHSKRTPGEKLTWFHDALGVFAEPSSHLSDNHKAVKALLLEECTKCWRELSRHAASSPFTSPVIFSAGSNKDGSITTSTTASPSKDLHLSGFDPWWHISTDEKELRFALVKDFQSIKQNSTIMDLHEKKPQEFLRIFDFASRNEVVLKYYKGVMSKETFTLVNELWSEMSSKSLPMTSETNQSSIETNQSLTKAGSQDGIANFSCGLFYGSRINPLEGLIYQPVSGQGNNCFFNAIAMHLPEEMNSQTCREYVIESILGNSEYMQALPLTDGQTVENYINALEHGGMVDHPEILIMQTLLNRPIIILRTGENPTILGNSQDYAGAPIFIYYNGHNHFDTFIIDSDSRFSAKDILQNINTAIATGKKVSYEAENPDMSPANTWQI